MTPLPHNPAAEAHVLAVCLLDGAESGPDAKPSFPTLNRVISAGITTASFSDPAHCRIFGALLSLRQKKTPLDIERVASELNGSLELVGGWPRLLQIFDATKIPTTAFAGHFISEVVELERRRAVLSHAQAVTELLQAGTAVEDLPAPPRFATPSAAPDFDGRLVTLSSKPVEPTTRLFLANKPIATPGNLVTLISKAKTGKTATIGSVVAAIIGAHYDRQDLDTFGFTAPHTDEAVVLIDTEQSPFDAFTCHQRAFARAGQTEDVSWFKHYALVGYAASQLRASLPVILAKAKAAHREVFTVILDGVADFVASVNDEAECNDFIAWLRGLAVEFNCPILCVIHSNEAQKSGDDGRGHLGKQLTRKAESNLLLRKQGEVTQITSEKQRKAPITEADGIAFQWSDEHQRHVSCQHIPSEKGKAGRKTKYDPDLMIAAVPAPGEKPKSVNAIHRDVGELPCSIDIRTFKDWMAKWVENGEVVRSGDIKTGYYFARSQ